MSSSTLYHTFHRYRTLQTDRITALPIVILMPHSACNCKCVMCDIWKGNHNLRQLSEKDIEGLLGTLRTLGTRQVLMSGGEALLNPNFFRLCAILKKEDGLADFSQPASAIVNRIRGFQPWPGVYTKFRGKNLQIARSIEVLRFDFLRLFRIEEVQVSFRDFAGAVTIHIRVDHGDRRLRQHGNRSPTFRWSCAA